MVSCPSCAAPNVDEAVFCTECGFNLRASGAPPGGNRSGAGRRSSNPTPGMMIDGKYAVERVLGEGAMGIVYVARDVVTETRVVVKSIRSELADSEEFRARAI